MSDNDIPGDVPREIARGSDPVDQAYVQAEAMVVDEAARAARRARVLAAVAREAGPQPSPLPLLARRPVWRRAGQRPGGWLAAACVAGLSLVLVTRSLPPALGPRLQSPSSAASARPMAPAPPVVAHSPKVRPVGPPPPFTAPERLDSPAAPAMATKPSPTAPPPAAAMDEQAAVDTDAAVRGYTLYSGAAQRRDLERPSSAKSSSPVAEAPPDPGSALRAAAAAGRASEVETLLAQGAIIDAPDADGQTALMRGILGDHPDVVAILRRHGASLDRKNHAGRSARDMAGASGDAAITRAVGLNP